MSSPIEIQTLPAFSTLEMAERKGIGHPDTICDAIVEEVSMALCRYYLKHFGQIFHYNVDKALLVGGASTPAFSGGTIQKPIELYIAGRATSEVNGVKIPVDEIALNTAKNWLATHLRFLDPEKHIRILGKIRPGSQDLVDLFKRFGKGEIPLSNDTSFGVGYYPLSTLERNVLEMELLLNHPEIKVKLPYVGEDIKVMGVRNQSRDQYTIAIAMVDKFVNSVEDYMSKIQTIKGLISSQFKIYPTDIFINVADDYQKGSVYLTVSGTSAEGGDDGQVGRGNRVNGLITPYRPMSLEASAGKNPVSHVGKIYNHFAFELSKQIVDKGFASDAEVYIVSQIGKPITQPQLVNIKLRNRQATQKHVEDLVYELLEDLPDFWKKTYWGLEFDSS